MHTHTCQWTRVDLRIRSLIMSNLTHVLFQGTRKLQSPQLPQGPQTLREVQTPPLRSPCQPQLQFLLLLEKLRRNKLFSLSQQIFNWEWPLEHEA